MDKQNLAQGFQQVDLSQHQFLVKFLEDVAAHPSVLAGFALQMELLKIGEGHRVLDVGCGIGIQAQTMATLVGSQGKVTGTDLSQVMVDIARQRTALSALPVEFLTADALTQPFPNHTFDRIRTERVLLYIKDIPAVLAEFKRLLRPGGKLLIFDFDWDAIVINHQEKELTRKIIRYVSDSFPSGRIGGELLRFLKEAGYNNVIVRPIGYYGSEEVLYDITKRIYDGILQTGVNDGTFRKEEIADWWKKLDDSLNKGNFFVSFHGFINVAVSA